MYDQFYEQAMIWDLLSLIDSCDDYTVLKYADDSRFKDFLLKYGINPNNIPVRINDIVKHYTRGGPGKKQLIRKEKLTDRKKKYNITEEGKKIIEDWDYKRLANDFTLIYLKNSLLNTLRELEDLQENYYLKNHYYRSNIRSLIKSVNDFVKDVDIQIVSTASHFHSPIENYFHGLKKDLPIREFINFLQPLLVQEDTYYTFNLIRQLYYHNSEYLKSFLTENEHLLEEMMNSLKRDVKFSISLIFHYYYIIQDLVIPSFIENTLIESKEYFSTNDIAYLNELLTKSSSQEAKKYFDEFLKYFDFKFIGRLNLSNMTGFLSTLLNKNLKVLELLLSSILENFAQYTTDDYLSFLNYLIIHEITSNFYQYENYKIILERLTGELPFQFYNMLDKVIIYTEEYTEFNVSLEKIALNRISQISYKESIELFISANSADLKPNSFLYTLIKQIKFDFIVETAENCEGFPLVYILNVLYRINRTSAKEFFSIIDKRRYNSILLNETSPHNIRVLFLLLKKIDKDEVLNLFKHNLSYIKTSILNDKQKNLLLLYDLYQLDPNLIIEVVTEILNKISEDPDFHYKVNDIIEHCKTLFEELKFRIEGLFEETNQIPLLLEYPLNQKLDLWSNEILLKLLDISIKNEKILVIQEIIEILGEEWDSEKIVLTEDLANNISNFVLNSLKTHSYKIAFHETYYKLTSILENEYYDLFIHLRTKMRLNELDYVLPFLAW